MQPELIPRVRIYLRQQRSKAEDFEDILTAGQLSWSDLEIDAKANLDRIGVMRSLDERAKANR